MANAKPRAREVIQELSWKVIRKGRVEEVLVDLPSGDTAVRYRTLVWDPPREPFTSTMFNDPTPALDLLERIMLENTSVYDKEVENDSHGTQG